LPCRERLPRGRVLAAACSQVAGAGCAAGRQHLLIRCRSGNAPARLTSGRARCVAARAGAVADQRARQRRAQCMGWRTRGDDRVETRAWPVTWSAQRRCPRPAGVPPDAPQRVPAAHSRPSRRCRQQRVTSPSSVMQFRCPCLGPCARVRAGGPARHACSFSAEVMATCRACAERVGGHERISAPDLVGWIV
jgi:hypothetical protein